MKSHEIAEQLEHISFIDPLAGKRLANKAWVAVEDVEALAKKWREKQYDSEVLRRIHSELDALLARAKEEK